ncbi:MAG: GNAT family protein [Bacteroidia bacterium]
MNTPENQRFGLAGRRVLLRPLREGDLADFLAYRGDPEVCRYQGFGPIDEARARSFIREQHHFDIGRRGVWMQIGIENRHSRRLIGDCAVRFAAEEPRIAEIGCTLHPAHQCQGYAREALSLLIGHLFRHQRIHKVIAVSDARNRPSIRMIIALGFTHEATLRRHYFDPKDQGWHDEWVFGLLIDDAPALPYLHPA